jgi:hypothetical protein
MLSLKASRNSGPIPGSQTQSVKVIDERWPANQATFGGKSRVRFPAGNGFQKTSVTFSW